MSDRIKVAVDAVGGTGSTGLNAYVMIEAANLPEPYRSAEELRDFVERVETYSNDSWLAQEARALLSRMPK